VLLVVKRSFVHLLVLAHFVTNLTSPGAPAAPNLMPS
jgi:hypothetical protein